MSTFENLICIVRKTIFITLQLLFGVVVHKAATFSQASGIEHGQPNHSKTSRVDRENARNVSTEDSYKFVYMGINI